MRNRYDAAVFTGWPANRRSRIGSSLRGWIIANIGSLMSRGESFVAVFERDRRIRRRWVREERKETYVAQGIRQDKRAAPRAERRRPRALARSPLTTRLRIAGTPANDRIKRWRLRIQDGSKHLWRELHIGDRIIKADNVTNDSEIEPSDATVTLELGGSTTADTPSVAS